MTPTTASGEKEQTSGLALEVSALVVFVSIDLQLLRVILSHF